MRIAFAIDAAEDDSIRPWLWIGVPTVDFREHGFHVRFTVLIFRVPPIERAQRFIERIARLLRLRDQTQSELMHEPPIRARIVWWIHRFFTPLQKPLGVCECTFLLGVTSRREEEHFSLDLLRLQLATLHFRRFAPEIR